MSETQCLSLRYASKEEAEALLAQHREDASIERVSLVSSRPTAKGWKALGASAYLPTLRELSLAVCGVNAKRLTWLLGLPLDALEVLDLRGNPLRDAGAALLADWTRIGQLRDLDLAATRIDRAGLERIVAAATSVEHFAWSGDPAVLEAADGWPLRGLRVWKTKLRAAGIARLVDAHADTLRELTVYESGLGDRALAHVAAHPALRLRSLRGRYDKASTKGLVALLEGPATERLEVLQLSQSRIDADGVDALVSSPLTETLRHLDLSTNALGDRALQALVATAFPKLKTLHVGQAQLMFPEATLGALDSALWPALRCLRIPFLSLGSSAAIDALVAWAGLARLEALDLEGTRVSVDAVRRIASAAPALRRLAIGQTPAADGADAIRSGHPELRVDVGVMSANHWPV